MTDRLKDKVALIFGAGSVGPGWGNGKATAALFAREGAKVVAVDVNSAAANETRDIITSEGGICEVMTGDVTRSDDVKRIVDRTVSTFGRIDVLHNNVGTTKMGGPIELDESDWHVVMDVNLKSIFLTCKHVLPVMLSQGKGAIVNISSLAAIRYVGYPYVSYYAAKAGVNQFTVGLALQYAAQGIRVNAIMPGLMNTPLIHQQISDQYSSPEEMIKARDAACPMGRMGTGWDIAHAALFLASEEAAYITGLCMPVDGGVSARCI